MKSVNKHLVAIKAFAIEEQEGEIRDTEVTRDQAMKKQNRGEVIKMGKDCDGWIEPGDTVSFYRNAATSVVIDGEELLIVNEAHILVKF